LAAVFVVVVVAAVLVVAVDVLLVLLPQAVSERTITTVRTTAKILFFILSPP